MKDEIIPLSPAKVGPPINDYRGWIPTDLYQPPVGQPVLAVITGWRIEGHTHQRGCPRAGVAVLQDDKSWLPCWPVGGSRWRALVAAWLPIPGTTMEDPGAAISAQIYRLVDWIIGLGDQHGSQAEVRKALADASGEIDLALDSIKRAGQPAQVAAAADEWDPKEIGL